MPTITGNVFDTGVTPLGPLLEGRVHVRIGRPERSSMGVHVTKDIVAPVSSSGAFSVELPNYVTRNGPARVWFGFTWFASVGEGSGIGAPQSAWLPDAVAVPPGGGDLVDLVNAQIGNDLVYAAPDAVNPSEHTGFQLNTITGDLYQWKG